MWVPRTIRRPRIITRPDGTQLEMEDEITTYFWMSSLPYIPSVISEPDKK